MKPSSSFTLFSALVCLSTLSQTAARLTPQERATLSQSVSNNGGELDYCSACLKKGMTNHFPHACSQDMPDPIALAAQTAKIQPEVVRCLCASFINASWMTLDCRDECEFAKYPEAMTMIPKVKDFPGCDRWVNLETLEELEVEGYAKRDPNYQPEVYAYEDDEMVDNPELRALTDSIFKELDQLAVLEDEDMDGDKVFDIDGESAPVAGVKDEL
ncbi:hypothetical protein BGZ99_005378 [Dissophora globulifera]|uniref:Uncharacterized protein n=1 Tax=Dissophora globulifera TaxID=979702 RepID=A0A9P6UTT4_9FUNG|nr:hypothetical protein BGZ99_005378 [Dissophora globulifera]